MKQLLCLFYFLPYLSFFSWLQFLYHSYIILRIWINIFNDHYHSFVKISQVIHFFEKAFFYPAASKPLPQKLERQVDTASHSLIEQKPMSSNLWWKQFQRLMSKNNRIQQKELLVSGKQSLGKPTDNREDINNQRKF